MIDALMGTPSAAGAAWAAGLGVAIGAAGAAAGDAYAAATGGNASALGRDSTAADIAETGGAPLPMVNFMSPISTCRKSQLDPFRLSINRVTASTSSASSTPVMFFTVFLLSA